MADELRIGVAGAAGRMGRAIIELAGEIQGVRIGAALERPGSSVSGLDVGDLVGIGALGVFVETSFDVVVAACDVLIDFSLPEGALAQMASCRAVGKPMVIGTTGFDQAGRVAIADAAREIPIVYSPNMSVGVNVCFKLAALAAEILGDETDIEIIEAHHRNKIDAPSGTAVRLGEIVAGVLNRDLEKVAVYGRQGRTGVRDPKTIGFETIRGGDIIGEHTVMFAGSHERVEITHRASNRMTFASGAIRGARFAAAAAPGLYDMQDVLGLS